METFNHLASLVGGLGLLLMVRHGLVYDSFPFGRLLSGHGVEYVPIERCENPLVFWFLFTCYSTLALCLIVVGTLGLLGRLPPLPWTFHGITLVKGGHSRSH